MRLARAGNEALQAEPAAEPEKHAWRLKLEGIVREIDASLAPEQMDHELSAVRSAILKILQPADNGQ